MKRVLLFLLGIVLFMSFANASQAMKHFRGDLFSLDYPSDFSVIPISKAPHMCLKIGNNTCIFTASCWNKGYDANTSIWDDEIYESCKSIPVNGDLLGVDKVIIATKQGKRRSIRIMSVIKGSLSSTCSVSYMMIHNGYLFVFCFFSEQDDLFISSGLNHQERFLKGLAFKNAKEKNEDFYSYLLKTIKGLNAQCPFKSDEITTYKNIILSGKTVCIKMEISDDYIESIDYSVLKSNLCANFSRALKKEFIMYLETHKYSMSYFIYDEEESLYKLMTISPQDILDYYD